MRKHRGTLCIAYIHRYINTIQQSNGTYHYLCKAAFVHILWIRTDGIRKGTYDTRERMKRIAMMWVEVQMAVLCSRHRETTEWCDGVSSPHGSPYHPQLNSTQNYFALVLGSNKFIPRPPPIPDGLYSGNVNVFI